MYYSPKTSTDGLVFHYDTGNTVRSYLGEPTTNQFTNPDFSNGTTGWTFGSWDGGRYTYTTETVIGPFGRPVTALKVVRTTSDTSYAHFHQGNGGKFTNGNTYTLSAYVKGSGTLNQNTQGGYSPITYNPGQSVTLTGEWQRISYTLPSQTDSLYPYWAAEGITQNVPMYFTLAQSEQKSHITPFINGTRSATQGLKDLTAKNTVDISSLSFDSSAQTYFDGTNDYIQVPTFNPTFSSGITMECVAYWTDSPGGSWQRMFDFGNGSNSDNLLFCRYADGSQLFFGIYNGSSSVYQVTGNGAILFGQTAHYTAVADGTNFKVYVNGQLIYSAANSTVPITTSRTSNYLGKSNWVDSYFNGQIPVAKIYNRALTADEVQRNFNAVKSRFNIA